jgi:hypothetical protein
MAFIDEETRWSRVWTAVWRRRHKAEGAVQSLSHMTYRHVTLFEGQVTEIRDSRCPFTVAAQTQYERKKTYPKPHISART